MKKLTPSIDRFINKYIIPALTLAVFAFTFVAVFLEEKVSFWLVLILIMLFVLVLHLIKTQTYDLVDTAYDNGDSLIFKKSGKSTTVKLSNIKSISLKPPSQNVVVQLDKETEFGKKICFALTKVFFKNQFIDELNERINKAKV